MTDTTAMATDTTARDQAANGDSPTAILKEQTYKTPIPTTELLRTDAGDVEATTISMDRSGAEHVTAERVVMNKSGAKTIEARSAQLDDSGAMTIQAEQVVLQSSSAMAVLTEEARVVNSKVGLVSAGTATFEPGSKVFIFSGGTINGDVRPVVDAAGAAVFGAALGFVLLVLGRVFRRASR